MQLLSYMHIGLLKIIEKPMAFLHATGFFLITKVQEEAKHLLQEKLQEGYVILLKE